MARITEEHLRALVKSGRVPKSEMARVLGLGHATPIAETQSSKYRNVKTQIDGVTFDSKREAARYQELRLIARSGRIRDIRCQVSYPLIVNGCDCGAYVADFVYEEFIDSAWRTVVEDVKSDPTKTPVYRLKKKLMLAIHGITITETR